MMRFDADHSATIRLHDEAAAIGFAILELVRHLLLEIYDVVESFLLKIPDVEDAGLRCCSVPTPTGMNIWSPLMHAPCPI